MSGLVVLVELSGVVVQWTLAQQGQQTQVLDGGGGGRGWGNMLLDHVIGHYRRQRSSVLEDGALEESCKFVVQFGLVGREREV